jgi:hypothetical protein
MARISRIAEKIRTIQTGRREISSRDQMWLAKHGAACNAVIAFNP